ncbi:hypothetical protein PYCCODRAFT_208126 [Trametes coccinea BRFM310]|uniref:Uncharacterized protein n=1 Tax=Trametes coccinea (strain BRFM310) TaxID=1353009 RepID=A0A1Y2IRU7_TRAC3|nr:hypothetical protein PYCCODRAFT_208126 [Trametes coccinea BRFM310]
MTAMVDIYSRAVTSSELASARSTIISCVLALFIESVLFGVFAVAYGVSTWILLYKRSPQGIFSRDMILFFSTTLMFLLATTHLAFDVYIAISSFLTTGSDLTAMSNVYESLNDWPTNPIGAAKFAFYVTQTLIGDGFMIYRAYIVWDRMWVVIVAPSILLLVEVVLGYITSGMGSLNATPAQAKDCVDIWCIISVVLNILCSGLIMKRILWPVSRVRACTTTKTKSIRRRVVESVIQSAAIYSVASISFGITSFLSPNIGFPVCHSLFPPVIGLVFLLIVIRINRNASNGDSTTSDTGMRYLQDTSFQSRLSSRPITVFTSVTSVYDTSPRRASFGEIVSVPPPTAAASTEKAEQV